MDFIVRLVAGLRSGYIPSMAEELMTDRITFRSREAESLMWGLAFASFRLMNGL
jgi:hypothetical protein